MPDGLKHSKWSEEKIRRLVKLWNDGITVTALAARFESRPSNVRNLIKRLRKTGKLYRYLNQEENN